VRSIGMSPDGYPIFPRGGGYDFLIVVEARPGGTRAPDGTGTFNSDPMYPTAIANCCVSSSALPDLQIEASQPLGANPTTIACNGTVGPLGGIPPVNPPDFSLLQSVVDAVNDFGCRFRDQDGNAAGRTAYSCVLSDQGAYTFVDPTTTVQFCGYVNPPFQFPVGDTLLSVRVRDVAQNVSDQAHIVVRVAAPPP